MGNFQCWQFLPPEPYPVGNFFLVASVFPRDNPGFIGLCSFGIGVAKHAIERIKQDDRTIPWTGDKCPVCPAPAAAADTLRTLVRCLNDFRVRDGLNITRRLHERAPHAANARNAFGGVFPFPSNRRTGARDRGFLWRRLVVP